VGDVVGHEAHLAHVQPREGRREELRRPFRVDQPQVVPRVVEAHVLGRLGQGGVE
jgi:hypothetical protein